MQSTSGLVMKAHVIRQACCAADEQVNTLDAINKKLRQAVSIMTLSRSIFHVLTALALVMILGATQTSAQGTGRIQLEQLESMFSNMKAKVPWDVNGPLLWGYFFFDPSREKLALAASDLESKGYRVVNLSQVRSGIFRLHVERIETHTPLSLDSRNQEFYSLAERYRIASYDGMDVGPVQAEPRR